MNRLFSVAGALLLILAGQLMASPLTDLASPDQTVRDRAAADLRATFQEIPRSKWQPTFDSFHTGQTKSTVMKLFEPFHPTPYGGMGSGGTYLESYRLVDGWVLTCSYEHRGDVLIDKNLERSINSVWVAPRKISPGNGSRIL